MPRFSLRLLSISALLALGLLAAPLQAKTILKSPETKKETSADANDTFKQLTLFSDVLERTRADYVDTVTDQQLIESALNGMLSSLDPHSGYMNQKSYEEMQTQTHGEFGGLGIEVTMENSLVKVISPIDDTPAAKAGIQPNDLITHLDGKPVTDLSLNEAVDHMRGKPGTKIVLTIRRGGIAGRPFDVTLVRAIIHVNSVKWEPKDNVAYIRITTFNNEHTQAGLENAITEAKKKIGDKLVGYVLDLRNNPGGLLDQAVSVAGTFLPAGKEVVSTRSRHKEENQSFVSKGGDRTGGKPIAILINGGSASASEIVAGALQDYHRAILIGTKSFGKGSVQTIIPLGGSGAMRLTTARYHTPSGRSIQQLGIEPDITVQQAKLEEIAQGHGLREADLRGALSNDTVKDLKSEQAKEDSAQNDENEPVPAEASQKDKKGTGKDGKKEEPFDYQLDRALDLIRGVALFKKTGLENVEAKP